MKVRRAWCAAAAIAGLAVGVAGCGSPPAPHGAPGGAPAAASSSAPVPTDTSTLIDVPYSSPTFTDPPAPVTPEEKINALAAEKGWFLGDEDVYDDAAGLVQDVCDTLADPITSEDSSPAQWLGSYGYSADERHLISAGVPLLCPKWTKTTKAAFAGQYPVYFTSGTYKVTSRRADDTVPPGTYRTTGDLSGCYWERTKADGTIIDNNFATAATRITVTILPSDDLFTSQECGTWKPVH